MKDNDLIKLLSTVVVFVCAAMILTGCATKKQDKTNYKISVGKKCSKDNTTFSYLWFIDVVGNEPVKKEYCK